MKKSVIVFLIVIEILLIFVFQNIYFLFKSLEGADLSAPGRWETWGTNFSRMRKIFFLLSAVTGIFLIGTGIYLAFSYRKSKGKYQAEGGIPPLQNYLLELKDSETSLKDMVEKQQEKAVKEENLSRSIVNNMDAAIVLIGPGERIDIFNAEAEAIFGQSYAHARNNAMDNILGGFPELVTYIRDHSGVRTSADVRCGRRILETHVIPMPRVGVLLMIRDVTALREREAIDQKNRNFIMLGDMTAFLAHEVRNSLGVIYGYAKSFQSGIKRNGEPEGGDKMKKVTREIEFLSEMMEKFLNFSKPVPVAIKEPVDLIGLVRRLARDKGLRIDVPDGQFTVDGDPALLASVFTNLFLNAREAGATRVEVEMSEETQPKIVIRDDGKGIPDEELEKIWYPLFTTKEKGTGMGLAIVRKILNSMGANIWLLETGRTGTSFQIDFFR